MRAPNDSSNSHKRRRYDPANFTPPVALPSSSACPNLPRSGPSSRAAPPSLHPFTNLSPNYRAHNSAQPWNLPASSSAPPPPPASSSPVPNGATHAANASHTTQAANASDAAHAAHAAQVAYASNAAHVAHSAQAAHATHRAQVPSSSNAGHQTLPPFSMSLPPLPGMSLPGMTLPPISGNGHQGAVPPFFAPGGFPPALLSGGQSSPAYDTFPPAHSAQAQGHASRSSALAARGVAGRNIYTQGRPSQTHDTRGGAPWRRGMPAVQRERSGAGGSHGSRPGYMPELRSITPVVDALALLKDDSTIISALSRLLSLAANRPLSVGLRREQILAFTGFLPSDHPPIPALAALSKSDLDVLAWIFVVSKNGRKDDVARRIVSSLRAPLKHRVPPESRRPYLAERLTGKVMPPRPQSHTAATSRAPVAAREAPPPRQRSNMPALAAGSELAPDLVLAHLQRQLQQPNGSRTASSYQSLPSASHGSSANDRGRQTRDSLHDVLAGYSFKAPENPFNIPLNRPLGQKNFVVFSSVQLTRGNSDPVLIFPTPSPIDPGLRPEIRGGDVQIHLRCLQIDLEKAREQWKQTWPFPASCRVNGHLVTLNQAQRYTNGKLAGLDTATNISPFLRKPKSAMSESNRVTIRRQASTATSTSGQFVMVAQEILVLSQGAMVKAVHESSEKYWIEYRKGLEKKRLITPESSNYEMARHGVVMFLTDPDGLTVASMKVSLRCPLALTRIITPVKGKRCQHVQCFDLVNFLEYSRRSSKFDCPVCNKHTADPTMLVISPYIEHALQNFSDCDEVEIFQDGSMVKVERKQTGVASDDDDDDVGGSQLDGGDSGSKPGIVVDLTLDSDDEEPSAGPQAALDPMHAFVSQAGNGIGGHHGSIAGGRGNSRQKQDHSGAMHNGNLNENRHSNDVGQVDQDLEFTFHSDFWGNNQGDEHMQADTLRPTPALSNNRNGWPDVIAIDSD